jgi:hypothetical protein
MPTVRRGLLSRFGSHSSSPPSRDLPPTVNRFDLRITDNNDTASIRTVLPAYTRSTDSIQRPTSPTPTYYTIDESSSITPSDSHTVANSTSHRTIDEFVNRLRESLKNPKSWRLHNNGQKSFFWALRCIPGTAELLNDNIQEIKDRAVTVNDWQIKIFCFIFKGQKLLDLWCRPILTEVFLR